MDRFKSALRKTYQSVRKTLPSAYQLRASRRICSRIKSLENYRYAKHIALYYAIHGEVSLNDLWQSAPLQGKYCYFPVLNDNLSLSFIPATPASHFNKNRFGILEPTQAKESAINPSQLDIIFMPLVSFDEKGTRLGMGAGYYDRTLAQIQTKLLIGVAYEFQKESFIPEQAWDIPLSAIVTEKRVYWRSL